jgi:hypothetical protein
MNRRCFKAHLDETFVQFGGVDQNWSVSEGDPEGTRDLTRGNLCAWQGCPAHPRWISFIFSSFPYQKHTTIICFSWGLVCCEVCFWCSCQSCPAKGLRGCPCHKSPGLSEKADTDKTSETFIRKRSVRFMDAVWLGSCDQVYSIVRTAVAAICRSR